ncbi:sensor histidine kinase [Amycolatopsis balhimycina]|uniref:sensor histidine kinase n=1 Tax=Amycolatopsis balhimycina TaxID=208443 RepID=UPI000F79C125|nr:HAMP domain-containing sensor histidine kinase [Amycolatopsis balhimycina]
MRSLRSLTVGVQGGRSPAALVEAGGLTALVVLALWQVDRWDGVPLGPPARDAGAVLALAAAGVATAAAVVAALGPAEAGHRKLVAPLGFYGLVVIPAGVVGGPGPGMTIARFVASCLFLVLAATALPWSARSSRPFALAGTLLVAGIALSLLEGYPVAAHVIVVGGWWVVAAGFVAAGTARAERATWRIGIGLSLVAVAHLEAFTSVPEFLTAPELEFGGLRLLGLFVVLVMLARPVGGALRAARADAEREHEIRNVLSGLSGVGYLLDAGPETLDRGQRAELASAMRAELARVGELLGDRPGDQDGDTPLRPLLTQLVALRCARGERVELDVPPCLWVAMPAHALTQVLTNLLANCDRHAHGSRVRVVAAADGDRVTITVADDGPGLPEHGHPKPGIGLSVCTRLLAEHGGQLWLGPPGPGCTVEVRVPAVADIPAPRGSPVRVGSPQVV